MDAIADALAAILAAITGTDSVPTRGMGVCFVDADIYCASHPDADVPFYIDAAGVAHLTYSV